MMNEFDNEELSSSFENIMKMFISEIKPYALNIVEHLKTQYFKCVNADQFADKCKAVFQAMLCF